jgi:hypothetical protein
MRKRKDPDPGGQKTCGSDGSGSATLAGTVGRIFFLCCVLLFIKALLFHRTWFFSYTFFVHSAQVKENSVNLIFAVTEEQLHVYNLLSGAVEGSSYGERFLPVFRIRFRIRILLFSSVTFEMATYVSFSTVLFACYLL